MASPVKLTTAVVSLLALVAAPSLLLSVLGFDAVAGDAMLATATGLIAATFGPWRPAAVAALLLGLGAGVAIVAAPLPGVAAVLMAACGLAMGIAARFGVAGVVVMAPIAVAFVLAEPPAAAPLAAGVAYAAAAGFGVMVGAAVRRRLPHKALEPVHSTRALAYGGTLALLAGVSAWFVADRNLGHAGAWLLMTFFSW